MFIEHNMNIYVNFVSGGWPADVNEGRRPLSNCCNQSKVLNVSRDIFVCHKEQELEKDFTSLIKTHENACR